MRTVAACATCDRTSRIHGRGLCHTCYERHNRAGTLIDFPAGYISREMLLEEYRLLRSDGVLVRSMPGRIGTTPAAFERALFRARAAGDPRAADFRGMAA